MKKQTKDKGITLIALVITIIVLLILAAVSIATLTGENGLLAKATTAKQRTEEEEARETVQLEVLASIDQNGKYIPSEAKKNIENNLNATVKQNEDGTLDVNYKNYNLHVDEKGIVTIVKEESQEPPEENSYIKDNLIRHYDAINNTGEGDNKHNTETATWKDLSGHQDATINGATMYDNYLSFDGQDDCVNCGEITDKNIITLEATIMLKSYEYGARAILCNYESGGIGLHFTGNSKPKFMVHINGEYAEVILENTLSINQIYTLTGTYDGNILKFYINGDLKGTREATGGIDNPADNTVMMMGSNPRGALSSIEFANINIYSARIYEKALTESEIKKNYGIDKQRFNMDEEYATTDGLVLYYDGINNTGNEHSNNSNIWKDLSGNNHDGTLTGENQNSWLENSLKFDGINDYVSIGQMNYEKITLEAVVEYDSDETNKCVISNYQLGGYALENQVNKHRFSVYIKEDNAYKNMDEERIEKDKKYFMLGSYDKQIIKFFINGNRLEEAKQGSIKSPDNDTIMMLGANPKGQEATDRFLNGKIYSIRVYNRALTDEEAQRNYNVSKKRFNF